MQGASTVSTATQRGKTSSKEAAAASARKKKPVVLSSGSESEEEEEESSSEDEAEGLEIERVLHGRPNADTKQEEFLVKLKGDSVCKRVAILFFGTGFLLQLVVSKATRLFQYLQGCTEVVTSTGACHLHTSNKLHK